MSRGKKVLVKEKSKVTKPKSALKASKAREKGRTAKLSPAKAEQLVKIYERGKLKVKEIAEKFGVTPATVYRYTLSSRKSKVKE
ncbi:MAG TPA: helix-turn-helix domain-containing protein [Gammaproteobacteria bacterium]|jgi:DNA invertase Pin-like site-specific DNA recombinase|nr:helix-turn-helix domain-containing protein [Gammaproteobacteria bacterium]